MVIEIIHDQLAQIIGCRLRVKMVKQLLESLDMSIIPAMDDMLPDMTWNELYPAAPHEARTIAHSASSASSTSINVSASQPG